VPLQRRALNRQRGCWGGGGGCDPLLWQDGHTPLHYAVNTGVMRCVQNLVQFKADVNAPNDVRLSRPRSGAWQTSLAPGVTPAMPLWVGVRRLGFTRNMTFQLPPFLSRPRPHIYRAVLTHRTLCGMRMCVCVICALHLALSARRHAAAPGMPSQHAGGGALSAQEGRQEACDERGTYQATASHCTAWALLGISTPRLPAGACCADSERSCALRVCELGSLQQRRLPGGQPSHGVTGVKRIYVPLVAWTLARGRHALVHESRVAAPVLRQCVEFRAACARTPPGATRPHSTGARSAS
jgi:hypothetical protein